MLGRRGGLLRDIWAAPGGVPTGIPRNVLAEQGVRRPECPLDDGVIAAGVRRDGCTEMPSDAQARRNVSEIYTLAPVAVDGLRDDHGSGRSIRKPLVDAQQPLAQDYRVRVMQGLRPAWPHRLRYQHPGQDRCGVYGLVAGAMMPVGMLAGQPVIAARLVRLVVARAGFVMVRVSAGLPDYGYVLACRC